MTGVKIYKLLKLGKEDQRVRPDFGNGVNI